MNKTQTFEYKDGNLITRTYGHSIYKGDFDNPDLQQIKNIVLADFKHKLWVIFYENLYAFPANGLLWEVFFDKYIRCKEFINIPEENIKKDICKFTNLDKLQDEVYSYIDNTCHNLNIYAPINSEFINNMFGEGYFPFIDISLIKDKDKTIICYQLYE